MAAIPPSEERRSNTSTSSITTSNSTSWGAALSSNSGGNPLRPPVLSHSLERKVSMVSSIVQIVASRPSSLYPSCLPLRAPPSPPLRQGSSRRIQISRSTRSSTRRWSSLLQDCQGETRIATGHGHSRSWGGGSRCRRYSVVHRTDFGTTFDRRETVLEAAGRRWKDCERTSKVWSFEPIDESDQWCVFVSLW